ncbi:helix-turn-helix domain-containing protein [Paenibacillus mesophilus]|uniref:helix-turn-helix transcriptional regulator n=1 Tax=Paenibacillus mesophilus TaxID=2582849 RepID=UPI00110EB166|nr:AraC family transcriptional regulator [Paenibacillus mesophilus]TMV47207.1 helix-turn-helix domain-containing protein [Paenibacillus mesophilus]
MIAQRPVLLHDFRYRSGTPIPVRLHGPHHYEIRYFHDGNGEYRLGESTLSLAAGDLLIADGTKQHGQRDEGHFGTLHTSILFHPSVLRTIGAQVNGIDLLLPFEVLGHFHTRLTGSAMSECESILLRIARFHPGADWVCFNRLVMAFSDLLIVLYAQCEPAMKALNYTLSDKERNVRKMIAFLETAFNEDLSLDAMEKELHLSKQYMSKIFRENTGMTIFDYLYRRRVDHAKRLLHMQKECSITDICFQAGFKNVSHFSRLFKERVGMTPENYRRLVKPELPDQADHISNMVN